MHWIAPTEKNAASAALEKRLWDAADPFGVPSSAALSAARIWPPRFFLT